MKIDTINKENEFIEKPKENSSLQMSKISD